MLALMPLGWWQIWQRYRKIPFFVCFVVVLSSFSSSLFGKLYCGPFRGMAKVKAQHTTQRGTKTFRIHCDRVSISTVKQYIVEMLFAWHFAKADVCRLVPARRTSTKKKKGEKEKKNREKRKENAPRFVCTIFHRHGRLILSTLNWCSGAMCFDELLLLCCCVLSFTHFCCLAFVQYCHFSFCAKKKRNKKHKHFNGDGWTVKAEKRQLAAIRKAKTVDWWICKTAAMPLFALIYFVLY